VSLSSPRWPLVLRELLCWLSYFFFRDEQEGNQSGSIVPIAFPLLAGAGTLTTILSLKAEFDTLSIAIGIIVNLLFIFIILRSTDWLSKKMSPEFSSTMRKVFGILLIAIAIQMAKEYI